MRLLRRVRVELASRRTIFAPLCQAWLEGQLGRFGAETYAALQRSTIDVIATQLTDGHCCVFVRIHLDESKATIRLEACLGNKTEVLEKRNEVVLSRVRSKVADIARGLPLWGLRNDHLVALHTVSGEVVMAVWSCRSHSHGRHSLLLRDRRLALLIGPIATNGPRSKPFAVHGAQSLLGITTVAKCHEAIATRATCLHVPHDTSFGNGSKGRECLK